MTQHSLPLVGAHFRPPAKAILNALPAGHTLYLWPEPTNPYDPNAVAVIFYASSINDLPDTIEELEATLPPMGSDIDSLFEQDRWHLGYMPKEHAANYQTEIARILDAEQEEFNEPSLGFPCTLGFSGTGKYQIIFDL